MEAEEVNRFFRWRDGLADYAAEELGSKAGTMVMNASDDELARHFVEGTPRTAIVARLVLARLGAPESPLPLASYRARFAIPEEVTAPIPRHSGIQAHALKILRGFSELFF